MRGVALKVIKLGMATKQVVARFEAERLALAMMDHPNIAKVLDSGTTEVGRRYLVMELVRGISPPRNGSICSSRFARPSSTRTRRGGSRTLSGAPTSLLRRRGGPDALRTGGAGCSDPGRAGGKTGRVEREHLAIGEWPKLDLFHLHGVGVT
jgi:hypothetical protein